MRHRRSIPKLGVKTAHRKAMLSNMATSLLDNGQIKTTVGRAKALVPMVSQLITLARRGDVHARRQIAAIIKNKIVLKKLFDNITVELKDKPGGYARIVKAGFRKGDGASMAIVQLLIEKKEKEAKKTKSDKKTAKVAADKKSAEKSK
jgi:large subunit ribosomal protein L17